MCSDRLALQAECDEPGCRPVCRHKQCTCSQNVDNAHCWTKV